MHQDDESSTLLLFQQILKKLNSLDENVGKLNESLVGRENCATFRSEFDKRLRAVEEICISYSAVKPSMADEAQLLALKDEINKERDAKDEKIIEKLESIEQSTKFMVDVFHLSWCGIKNSKLIIVAGSILLSILYFVLFARVPFIEEIGWYKAAKVAIVVAVIMLLGGLIVYMIMKHEGRIRMHFQ